MGIRLRCPGWGLGWGWGCTLYMLAVGYGYVGFFVGNFLSALELFGGWIHSLQAALAYLAGGDLVAAVLMN